MTPRPNENAIINELTVLHQCAATTTGVLILASFAEDPTTGDKLPPWVEQFAIGEVANMVACALEWTVQPHRNVYVPWVVMRPDLPRGDKGGENDVVSVLGVVADFDDPRASEWATRVPMPPTVVLNTSPGRYQCRYIFKSPLDPARAKDFAIRLAATTACDPGTKDISHVWRVAGTLNWPNKKKADAGRAREPWRVVEGPGGSDADPKAFDTALPQLPPPTPTPPPRRPVHPIEADDRTLLTVMWKATNGHDVKQLWRGSWEGAYPSQSEADLALCTHLAFYCGRDARRMDTLFRQSGLMREKWDRVHYSTGETYGEHTVASACAVCTDVYDPRRATTKTTHQTHDTEPHDHDEETTAEAEPDTDPQTPDPTAIVTPACLDPNAPWLEAMNAENFIVNHGREVLVYRPAFDPVLRRRKYNKHPFAALKELYQNDLVKVVQDSGRVVRQNKATAWLAHPRRRQYVKGAFYAPDQTLPEGMFNLDTGFGIEPKPGRWPLMSAHLQHVIASGDDTAFRYLMGWLAHAVQRRADRGHVALVLRGDRGVGKGILGNSVVRIFGQHGIYLSNSEQLVGKFNSHLEDASFLFGDECFFPHDKKHLSTLKALVTESTVPIEAKFESVRMARNCLHILLASNDDFVVPAGRDERRFCVLDVADTHKQSRAYFDPLRQELGLDPDTDGQAAGASAMLYDLLHYDLSGFDITQVPQTTALLDQKLTGMSGCAKWLFDCLAQGVIPGAFIGAERWEQDTLLLEKQAVYGTYRDFSHLTRDYRPEETGPWMKELKKMLRSCVKDSRPWKADGPRPRMLTFQPLQDCRTAFEGWIGHPIEWRTEEEIEKDRGAA